jgi:hypothetical protein
MVTDVDESADEAMDFALSYIDSTLCAGKFGAIDTFLDALDPLQLPAEVIVMVLVASLGAKSQLSRRADFIERAKPVLAREPEGLELILVGLE